MRRTCCKRATIGLGSYPSVRARAPGQFDFAACRGGDSRLTILPCRPCRPLALHDTNVIYSYVAASCPVWPLGTEG